MGKALFPNWQEWIGLEELRLLVAVVDAGSLAAAGRQLGHSPPAVTRALAALEERLGLRLLERSTRRLAPTEAGRRLAGACPPPAGRLCRGDGGHGRGGRRPARPAAGGGAAGLRPLACRADPGGFPGGAAGGDGGADPVRPQCRPAGGGAGCRAAHRPPGARAGWWRGASGSVRRVVAASPGWVAAHGLPARPEALAGVPAVVFTGRAMPPDWIFHRPEGGTIAIRIAPRLTVNEARGGGRRGHRRAWTGQRAILPAGGGAGRWRGWCGCCRGGRRRRCRSPWSCPRPGCCRRGSGLPRLRGAAPGRAGGASLERDRLRWNHRKT